MLYPMIDPSFSNYGRIEDLQVSASENVSHIVIEQQDHQILYCFDYDTFWDYEEGMTVLLIQDTGEQKLYYMDRAVTIFAGIHFGFYPLSSQSRILTNTELT